jgi:hypothetical protein
MCLRENEVERFIDTEVGKPGVDGGSSEGAGATAGGGRGGGGREEDVELRPRRTERLDSEVFRFEGTLTSENDAVRRAVCAMASW